MKKSYYLMFISVTLLSMNIFAQKSRVNDVLLHESFETNSNTLSTWANYASTGCSSYTWTYETTGGGANGSNRYAKYQSSAASAGCYATLATPVLQASKIDNNDSFIIDFYAYRYATSSSDYIAVTIQDEKDNDVYGPFQAFANDTKNPSSSPGWYHFFWKTTYDQLYNPVSTTGFKVAITGISSHGVDLLLDEVNISHISYQIVHKINFANNYKGDTLTGGDTTNIKWTSQNVNKVEVWFSSDSGKNYNLIDDLNATDLSYTLKLPRVFTKYAFLKLVDHDLSTNYAISGPFTIIIRDGISPIDYANCFSLYPNPAQNSLHLNFNNEGLPGNTIATLYDISGKLVLNQSLPTGASESYLDVHSIPNGVYILGLYNDKMISRLQVIISR